MLSPVTLSESTLMFRENLIKITVNFIKHTSFMNFGENGKDTNGTIIFDIIFALFYKLSIMSAFFNSKKKIELSSELLTLLCIK